MTNTITREFLRPGVLPDRTLRLFACWCAREACRVEGWDDPRSSRAIEVSERFADGLATAEELAEARRSAASAAYDSAADAYAAAYAYAAASASAPAAAAAAYDYADAKARESQVDYLRQVLTDAP